MATIQVRVGKSETARFTGVQPPITEELEGSFLAAEFADPDVPSTFLMVADDKKPWSLASFNALDYDAPRTADNHAIVVAHKVGNVLRHALRGTDNTVRVDETLRDMNDGRSLFDNQD